MAKPMSKDQENLAVSPQNNNINVPLWQPKPFYGVKKVARSNRVDPTRIFT